MKVNEIFLSIEGEGKRSGELAAFIRLMGCNLRCFYCDTRYAFNDGDEMSAAEIADAVKDYRNVTLTGGEPLIQNCHELLKLLSGHEVNIETNGSVDIAEYLGYENVFFTMDFKCLSSGMMAAMSDRNLVLIRDRDVLKFVVGDKNDLAIAEYIASNVEHKPLIYVSPVFGGIEPLEIVEFMKARRLQNWRLQLQLHKIVWSPEERGV